MSYRKQQPSYHIANRLMNKVDYVAVSSKKLKGRDPNFESANGFRRIFKKEIRKITGEVHKHPWQHSKIIRGIKAFVRKSQKHQKIC